MANQVKPRAIPEAKHKEGRRHVTRLRIRQKEGSYVSVGHVAGFDYRALPGNPDATDMVTFSSQDCDSFFFFSLFLGIYVKRK